LRSFWQKEAIDYEVISVSQNDEIKYAQKNLQIHPLDNMTKATQNTMEHIIRPRKGIININFSELWRYRELFGFLTWRDVIVRYKQTAIGILWAILQPLLAMVVFTVIFGKLAKFPSNNAPYAVMTFAALLPWQFFSNALTRGSDSVVGAGNMVRKIYFPRLIIPASATLGAVVDFIIAFVILILLMFWYGVSFRLHLLLLPAFFSIAVMAAFGASLWFSALSVKYRDVKHVMPFIVRMGIYISPVGFMSSVIPGKWQFLYSLNPMVGVIDGFRWAILGPQFEPYWPGFWVSLAMVVILLISGAFYFRAFEKTFADVI
jgi:lipopolysaccharide transport system permease protein